MSAQESLSFSRDTTAFNSLDVYLIRQDSLPQSPKGILAKKLLITPHLDSPRATSIESISYLIVTVKKEVASRLCQAAEGAPAKRGRFEVDADSSISCTATGEVIQ